jgi:hypothetical protein
MVEEEDRAGRDGVRQGVGFPTSSVLTVVWWPRSTHPHTNTHLLTNAMETTSSAATASDAASYT